MMWHSYHVVTFLPWLRVFAFSKKLYLWPYFVLWQECQIDGWHTCNCITFLLRGNTYCGMMVLPYNDAPNMIWPFCHDMPLMCSFHAKTLLLIDDILVVARHSCLRKKSCNVMTFLPWCGTHMVWHSCHGIMFLPFQKALLMAIFFVLWQNCHLNGLEWGNTYCGTMFCAMAKCFFMYLWCSCHLCHGVKFL